MQPLTDAQLAAIAWADTAEATPALAIRLAAPYFTVNAARRRFRASPYGWHCALQIVTCRQCGAPLLCSAQRNLARLAHPACQRQRANAHLRARRAAGEMPRSTPHVAAWRQRHPDRAAEFRERENIRQREQWPSLPEDQQADSLSRAHEADMRDADITRNQATHNGAPWSLDDDAVIIARIDDPARDVALALGRSLWAVRNRRTTLRKRGVLDQRSRAGNHRQR